MEVRVEVRVEGEDGGGVGVRVGMRVEVRGGESEGTGLRAIEPCGACQRQRYLQQQRRR